MSTNTLKERSPCERSFRFCWSSSFWLSRPAARTRSQADTDPFAQLARLARNAKSAADLSTAVDPEGRRSPRTPTIEVIATGLDNPRGLAFGPGGALYVAEAGRGGTGACVTDPEGGTACYGPTGAITRIFAGHQTRIATGLPSLAGSDGTAATGPVDVSVWPAGDIDVITGLGGDPAARSALGAVGQQFGRVIHVNALGNWALGADVSAYEAQANPDGGEVDSNPYAIFTSPFGTAFADAGGNDLLSVGPLGILHTLAIFPDRMVDAPPFLGLPPGTKIPMQAVPTSVIQGPAGAYYVGQLTGFPFPVGGANVYRVWPGTEPQVFASGFTNIIDIALGLDGSLYVLEITHNGLLSDDLTGGLIRVRPNGTRTTIATTGLVAPGGIAIGNDGALYVTNYSIFPGMGEVVRIRP